MNEQNELIQDDGQEQEISIKELILKISEYYLAIRKGWKILLFFVIPIVAFLVYKTYMTPIAYKATYTFMINEDEGGGVNPVSSILGSFGFGGGSKSTHNLDKILELSTSREIIGLALFEKVEIGGQSDYFANHIIELFEYEMDWDDKG